MVRKTIKQQCTVITNLLLIKAYQFPIFCTRKLVVNTLS